MYFLDAPCFSWTVALTLTNHLPSFCCLENLRVLDLSWRPPHREKFLCITISGIYFYLWPAYYSSWVSDDRQGVCGSYSLHSAVFLPPVLYSGGIWLWLTFAHLYQSSIWHCVYRFFCFLVAPPHQPRSPSLSFWTSDHTCPVQMTSW